MLANGETVTAWMPLPPPPGHGYSQNFEKAEQTRPLTLAELEAIPYGEPVYIKHANGRSMSGWGIKAHDPFSGEDAYLTIQGDKERSHSQYLRLSAAFYGQTWTAWTHKPEYVKV